MASYRGHLMLSAPLGAGYGALALMRPEFDWGVIFLGAGLTTVGGLLPDLDSDSGVPVRELFGLMATCTAVLLYHPLHDRGVKLEETLCFMGLAYFLVRYVIANMFRRFTVHRGMYHSLPAMLISGLLVYLAYPSTDLFLRLYLSGGVMVGFLSHLVLDEFCAVDFMGIRIKLNKFAGSALKFGSPSWPATCGTYVVLFFLGYLAYQGTPTWARTPANWHLPGWILPDRHADARP